MALARAVAVVVVVVAAAGCGGSGSAQRGDTLQELWDRPGQNVAVVWGTSDYAPGRIRASFLVVRRDGKAIERPRARVWLAAGAESLRRREGQGRP